MISRIALALASAAFFGGCVRVAEALSALVNEESLVPTLSPTSPPTYATRRLLGYVRGTPAPTGPPTGPPTDALPWYVTPGSTIIKAEWERPVAPPAGMCFKSGPTDDLFHLVCHVPSETDCVDLDSEDVKWQVCWLKHCPGGTGRVHTTCCRYVPCTDTPTSGPTRSPSSAVGLVTDGEVLNGNEESDNESDEESDNEIDEESDSESEEDWIEERDADEEDALSREKRIAFQIQENAECRSGLELEYRYYTKLCRMVNQEECGRFYYRWYDSEKEEWGQYAAPCQWMPSKELWMGSKCVAATACMKKITWTPLTGNNRTTSFPSIASASDDFPSEPTPSALPSTTPVTSVTSAPTGLPTALPTSLPTAMPSQLPSQLPTLAPTLCPTVAPTDSPSAAPTPKPTVRVQADAAAFEPRCGKLAKFKSKIRSGRATFQVDSAFSCYKKCVESSHDFVRWSFAPISGKNLHTCDCFQAFVKLNFKNSKGHFGYTTLDSKPLCGSAKLSRKAKKAESGGVAFKLKSSYRSPETCLIACAAGNSEYDTFDSFNFKKGKCTCMIGDLSVKLGQAYGSISSV